MKHEHRGLSPSSAQLFSSCARKYYYKKIAKFEIDSDASEDTEAFDVGKCFHEILEVRRHFLSGLSYTAVEDTTKKYPTLNPEKHAPLILAMLKKYKATHEKSRLTAKFCEVPIETEAFYGIVDVVLEDTDKNWWIGDMKTSSQFSTTLIPTLYNHKQLNLYAAHKDQLALFCNLDPEKFKGCRYRLTTKSRLIRKASESLTDYLYRLDNSIRSIDFILPIEKMNPEVFYKMHAGKYYAHLHTPSDNPEKFEPNYDNCLSYFKPCEYFSRCHGSLFTESSVESIEG